MVSTLFKLTGSSNENEMYNYLKNNFKVSALTSILLYKAEDLHQRDLKRKTNS